MSSLKSAIDWLNQLENGLSILTPQDQLQDARSSAQELEKVIRKDPLLSLQLFRLAARNIDQAVEINTLQKTIEATGIDAVLQFARNLPRLNQDGGGTAKLMQSLGDSLVASSLLKSWHNWRQVEWKDEDHWACLFSSVPEWIVAYKEPMLLDGIEFRVNGGESVDQIFTEIFGFNYEDLYNGIVTKFYLPSLERLGSVKKSNSIQIYKYQALSYYLPISNHLATACRREWGTEEFSELVKKAQTATMIEDFEQLLPGWLALAAQVNSLPTCGEAILTYFQNQPQLYVKGYIAPFKPVASESVSNKNTDIASTAAIVTTPQKSSQPKAKVERTVPHRIKPVVTKPINKEGVSSDSIRPVNLDIKRKPPEKKQPVPTFERGDKIQLGETIYLFQNQVVRYSNEVVAFQALIETLQRGMGFSRSIIALHQPSVGQLRVQYRHGTEDRLQLHNLAFAVPESGIIAGLVEKSVSFWLKPENAEQAWQNLPRRFGEAVNSQDFFMKSIHINGKIRALVYADVYNQMQPLTTAEYNQFRHLLSLVEKVLNHSTPISSSET